MYGELWRFVGECLFFIFLCLRFDWECSGLEMGGEGGGWMLCGAAIGRRRFSCWTRWTPL